MDTIYNTIHYLVAVTAKDVEVLKYNEFNAAGAVADTLEVPCGFQFMI
jgi:hypothetical protein